MSIAIQAITNPQTTANLPVASRTIPAALVRHLETPTAAANIQVSEFQQGLRNAKIQLLASGELSVLCFDAANDYNELLIRQSVHAAVEAANGWVKGKF